MTKIKKEEKKKDTEISLVDRSITISTPGVQVHIETKDHRDSLKALKEIAESVIDKYRGV